MVRAAVIGCGRMGAGIRVTQAPLGWEPITHTEAVLDSGFELVGLSDVDHEKLEKHSEHYGVRGFADYREMLKTVKPDLVTIATRADERPQIIAETARHARMIYAEKPLATSYAGCLDALNSGALIGYGVNRRYHATYRRALELVRSGAIGEVTDIVAEFGRGQLFWTHAHTVDLFVMFLGCEFESAYAQITSDDDPFVDHAVFTFSSGARATITRSDGCTLRIVGTGGVLTIVGDGELIQLSTGSGYFKTHSVQRIESMQGSTVTALTELVQGIVSVTPKEILTGIKMLEACL